MLTEKLDTEDMQNVGMGDRYDGTVAYARDKRRQVALVEHFASEWKNTGEPMWGNPSGCQFTTCKWVTHRPEQLKVVATTCQSIVHVSPLGFKSLEYPLNISELAWH